MNVNFGSAVKTAKNVITANSPVLLLGTAIAGVIGTGILAAKGGYKARGIIDEATEEKGEDLTTQEKVQLTWLCYASPVLTGASTIAAATGVHYIHTKRFATMAGLYAVTSNKLDDYQEKAEEMLGKKKTQELQNAVAQKSVERTGPPQDHQVVMTSTGDELCQDELSGRYFRGSMNIIDAAINKINETLVNEGSVSLNDFYSHVGLPHIPLGEDLGWSGTKVQVEARYGNGELSTDGRPVICFWFSKEPKPKLGLSK